MTEVQFMKFVYNYFENTIVPTMKAKGLGQYSTPEDRFRNFNGISALNHTTKEGSALALVSKQIVCLFDTVTKLDRDGWPVPFTNNYLSLFDELLKDIIVYMLLIRGMIHDKADIS